jgi:hypothetical protein
MLHIGGWYDIFLYACWRSNFGELAEIKKKRRNDGTR